MKLINVLLALLVSLGMAALVGEVGLRLLGFGPPAINTEFDSKLGWTKRPNSTIERKTGEYDVQIRTDAAGLRDDFQSTDVAPADGTHRVLCLGDSFVLGYTVDRKDLFVDQLESVWRGEGRSVDVVNAGTQGYSTDQSLIWLTENGARFKPDLVLYVPYENDIWWNASATYVGEPKPMFGDAGTLSAGELSGASKRGWFGKTAIGNLFRAKAKMPTIDAGVAGRLPVERTSRLAQPTAEALAAEARTKMLFGMMADAARGMGAEFAVCPIPTREQVQGEESPGLDHGRPYRFFVEAAHEAGAAVVEPLAALKAAEEPYYTRDFHLNPRGNAALAGALYTAFDEAGLVPARAADVPAATAFAASGADGSGGRRLWPFWFAGLVAALGTLYTRTYRDESAAAGYLKVAALLSVVFTTAIGVSTLVAALPPKIGQVVLISLVLGILSFVAYKLGNRVGTIGELLKAFTMRGHWYLMPLLSVLLTVGSLLVVAASSPLVAPFIYTLF